MTASDTHRTIDAVWRIESARLIAGLARIVRDVGLAEELAQDALVVALERWPQTGVPDNPGAWLMATARNRALDRLRRGKRADKWHEELGRDLAGRQRAAGAGRGRAAAGTDPGRPGPAGAGGARPRGPHGDPGLTRASPRGARRRARAPPRPGPRPLGLRARRAGPGCAATGGGARRRAR